MEKDDYITTIQIFDFSVGKLYSWHVFPPGDIDSNYVFASIATRVSQIAISPDHIREIVRAVARHEGLPLRFDRAGL